ncbi:ABC transporter G family member 20-like isoform X1 [Ornithodoros turicata]|uniref:ABC transporter G family member 20-like isoform X1 n=1 Tax=Ornithodoros turicata TaxID=34597 RepID=UPI003139A5BD
MSKSQATVTVRKLCLSYDKGKTFTLNNACMTVPMGGIYGLLGASGCGKTTLLRCCVGLQRPDAGEIRVFGRPLNDGLVPGAGVGYMPQELALYERFTIAENLMFFGQLLGMSAEKLQNRMGFLCTLFELTPANRFIGNLSGGQQKRVSLAVALIHQPPFLILDEPTVGLDPVLRETIWSYFVNVEREERTTILVTTHFIEEIEQASVVGIMKSGKVWCELSPSEMKSKWGKSSLSAVYLNVCKSIGTKTPGTVSARETPADDVPPAPIPANLQASMKWNNGFLGMTVRTKALVVKNIIKIFRRFITGVFQIIVPACVGVVFCLFIGGKPFGLDVAVVDEDHGGNLSSQYIQRLDTSTVKLVWYDSLSQAYHAVLNQEAWAIVYFRNGFESAVTQKFNEFLNVPPETHEKSMIDIYMDSTDFEIRGTLLKVFMDAYKGFVVHAVSNHFRFNISVDGIRVEDPFYNGFELTFREFMGPGVIISLIFAMSISLTAILLVSENHEGLRSRCFVAGVTAGEVVTSHAIVQMVLAYMQTMLMLLTFVYIFDLPVRGSLLMAFLLPLTMAFCGMSFGFMASAMSSDETTALLTSLAVLYPSLLVGGVIWPLESIPKVMQVISEIVPQTLAVRGLRGAMIRDYGAGNKSVLLGLGSNLAWAMGFFAVAIIILARSKV